MYLCLFMYFTQIRMKFSLIVMYMCRQYLYEVHMTL